MSNFRKVKQPFLFSYLSFETEACITVQFFFYQLRRESTAQKFASHPSLQYFHLIFKLVFDVLTHVTTAKSLYMCMKKSYLIFGPAYMGEDAWLRSLFTGASIPLTFNVVKERSTSFGHRLYDYEAYFLKMPRSVRRARDILWTEIKKF